MHRWSRGFSRFVPFAFVYAGAVVSCQLSFIDDSALNGSGFAAHFGPCLIPASANSALRDALAPLPNRRYGDEFLRSVRHREALAIRCLKLLFAIDCFKAFKDTFGHETGGKALTLIGLTLPLASSVEFSGVLARGG